MIDDKHEWSMLAYEHYNHSRHNGIIRFFVGITDPGPKASILHEFWDPTFLETCPAMARQARLPSAALGGGWLAPREMWGGMTKVSHSGQHSQTNHEPYTASQEEVLEHPKTSPLLLGFWATRAQKDNLITIHTIQFCLRKGMTM